MRTILRNNTLQLLKELFFFLNFIETEHKPALYHYFVNTTAVTHYSASSAHPILPLQPYEEHLFAWIG